MPVPPRLPSLFPPFVTSFLASFPNSYFLFSLSLFSARFRALAPVSPRLPSLSLLFATSFFLPFFPVLCACVPSCSLPIPSFRILFSCLFSLFCVCVSSSSFSIPCLFFSVLFPFLVLMSPRLPSLFPHFAFLASLTCSYACVFFLYIPSFRYLSLQFFSLPFQFSLSLLLCW